MKTKEEFMKEAEGTIRNLFAQAKQFAPDIYGLTLHLSVCSEYESYDFHAYDEATDILMEGKRFISHHEDGVDSVKEEYT